MTSEYLAAARTAYRRGSYASAFEGFERAVAAGETLALPDFEDWAVAANLAGKMPECQEAFARGYREALHRNDVDAAARFAFWIGHELFFEGAMSQASGWFMRGRQLLAGEEHEHLAWGYLKVIDGITALENDPEQARGVFAEVKAIARRHRDGNLAAIAGHGLGRSLIRLRRIAEGMAELDEVMVAATSRELTPIIVGTLYCGVLEACHEVLDIKRAREWTSAMARWCDEQPELVTHRGPCMVYRAEVMQYHGAWSDALDEARRACEWLSGAGSPEGPADAYYRLGEIQRLRGEFEEAEESYRQASRMGRHPMPGLALLWLVRGRREAATREIRGALEQEHDLARRASLLDALVEAALAENDAADVRRAAVELRQIAETLGTPVAQASARAAEGAALFYEGDVGSALSVLREAWMLWQRLDAPFEAARIRVLMGSAFQSSGDHERAEMEFDAARWVFQELSAIPELVRVEGLMSRALTSETSPGNLTTREVDVLRCLARGCSNKEIAALLVISEHTVARHVQNLLAKLGHTSRTGLAAFAVAHGIGNASDGEN